MLEINKNAENYLNNFEAELNKYKTAVEKSIPIAKENLKGNDEFLIRDNKDEIHDLNISYWRFVTELKAVMNLVVLTDEKYDSLKSTLNSALHYLNELNHVINKK